MKLFYIVYFGGGALFFLNTVSTVIFKPRTKLLKKLNAIIRTVAFSSLWPLAIFSPSGRKILLNKTTNL